MNSNTNLARSVLVASLAMLLLSSLMALSGCSQEVVRARYWWRMDGGASLTWSRQQVGYPDNLKGGGGEIYCISAADAEHVWAVGNGGEIDALENGTWKQSFVTKPNDLLLSVSALDPSHVWVVGWNEREQYAAIWFFDGTSWKQQAAREFKGITLNAVYALGTKHVWAVGTGGTLWKKRNPGNGLSLNTVSAIDASQVWALGENPDQPGSSGVYCWDGSRWILSLQTSVKFIPTTVYAFASNHIWVSGTNQEPGGPVGEVAFFDGESWNFERIEVGIGFSAITASDPSRVWAVGNSILSMIGFQPPSTIYFGTNQH